MHTLNVLVTTLSWWCSDALRHVLLVGLRVCLKVRPQQLVTNLHARAEDNSDEDYRSSLQHIPSIPG